MLKGLIYCIEVAKMDSKLLIFIQNAIIKDQLSPFSNHNQAKYLGHTLIFPGHHQLVDNSNLEKVIHLFFHPETILILFNLNAWINLMKYIMLKIG